MKTNGGQAAQALGRARGGLSTKIHAGCINETTGVAFVLPGGACSDMPGFDEVCAPLPADPALADAGMDKGEDRNHSRDP